MIRSIFLALLSLIFPPILESQQVVLQPWTEVFGTVPGTSLGGFVSGIDSTAQLPYRACISSAGRTYFYRLQSPTDTTPQFSIRGDHALFGDLNDDGLTDVVTLVSVLYNDTVLIYWGTTTELDTISPLRIPGEHQVDYFQPKSIGDINNDGKLDLVIAAPFYPEPGDSGKVYIYLNPITDSIPDTTIIGAGQQAGLGYVCAIGDLNADGFNDLAVSGSNQNGPDSLRYDYVNLYWGNGIGTVNLTFGLQMRGPNLTRPGLASFDVNGDDVADLLWNTRIGTFPSHTDFVSVHFGGTQIDSISDLRLLSPGLGNFGALVINAGDMNGDGYNDVAVGAPGATINNGFVMLYGGGPLIDSVFDAAVGQSSGSYFGRGLSDAGDINHDGLDDIIIGAPEYQFTNQKGYWGIFLGDSTITVTDVQENQQIPSTFTLFQSYPNPFNPVTAIRYELGEGGFVSLEITNLLGERITTIVQEYQGPGSYVVAFDGTNHPTGIYLYTLRHQGNNGVIESTTKKMNLIK